MKLENILVIADRDDPKLPAVRAVLDLLPDSTARLHVVGFVYEQAAEEPGVLSETAAITLKEALLTGKKEWLERNLAALDIDRRRLRVEVQWAKDIVDWTLEAIADDRTDLVVKSGNRSETLFYTPADWHLLRRSPVPVLIVGKKLHKRKRRILAAIDAASTHPVQVELNRKVLAAAVGLAALSKAQVYAAHVISVSVVARDLDLIDAVALESEQRAKLGPILTDMVGEYGIPAQNVVIKLGPPDRVLVSIAAELKVDIVVMGTVGRTGIAGRLIGNTAEQVLQRLRTGMLAVRPD